MFTGIVETKGRAVRLRRRGDGASLRVAAPFSAELEVGESVSVNGVCQTVVTADRHGFEVDVIAETLSLSALGHVRTGDTLNLERALRAGDRMGGHTVTGHVDGTGVVTGVVRGSGSTRVSIRIPDGLEKYVVPRGSIAVDGVSLTVADVAADTVTVALIPETLRATRAGEYRRGTLVNIETDIAAKHQEKLAAAAGSGSDDTGVQEEATSGLTEQRLRELGFVE
jgi:riboflavin synthase